MAMRQPSPRTVAKATRLPVVAALDNSYRVGGDSNVYTVVDRSLAAGPLFDCGCQASHTGSCCSHGLAVLFYTQKADRR